MSIELTPRDERYLRRKHGHDDGPTDLVECRDGTWRTREERDRLESVKGLSDGGKPQG